MRDRSLYQSQTLSYIVAVLSYMSISSFVHLSKFAVIIFRFLIPYSLAFIRSLLRSSVWDEGSAGLLGLGLVSILNFKPGLPARASTIHFCNIFLSAKKSFVPV